MFWASSLLALEAGLKNKHLLPLLGKPVIGHTFDHAQAAGLLSKVVVSSDSTEILRLATATGFETIVRPAEPRNRRGFGAGRHAARDGTDRIPLVVQGRCAGCPLWQRAGPTDWRNQSCDPDAPRDRLRFGPQLLSCWQMAPGLDGAACREIAYCRFNLGACIAVRTCRRCFCTMEPSSRSSANPCFAAGRIPRIRTHFLARIGGDSRQERDRRSKSIRSETSFGPKPCLRSTHPDGMRMAS